MHFYVTEWKIRLKKSTITLLKNVFMHHAKRPKKNTNPNNTMISILKKLAFCALLGLATSVQASEVLMPNGDFTTASGAMWHQVNGGNTTYDYPSTGGNSGGYGVIDGTNSPWAIWVGNTDSAIPISNLGLSAGQTYTFKQDMKVLSGSNVGGFKIDFVPSGSTGDLRIPKIGDGSTWETYSYSISIPAGTTGIKIVPLWGVNSIVGFDNFRVENGAVPPPPVIPGIPNPGFETPGGVSWTPVGPITEFSYPTTGGNPGGYGVMDASNGQWGIWVANSDAVLTLEQLSLTAGNTYNFTMDMKIVSGNSLGGFKVDFIPAGSTGDVYKPIIGGGANWATYTFPVAIPVGTTAVKLVPLWGPNSVVGYDNIKVITTTVTPPPFVPDQIPNGNFETGLGVSWASETTGPNITYPSTNGNPGGHAVIDATANEGFAAIKAFDGAEKTFASLGLAPGDTATLRLDMKILEGSNIGGLRLVGPAGYDFLNRPTIIGNGSTWETYSITFTVPSAPAQVLISLVWGFNSKVAFDNVMIVQSAPSGPLQASITTGTAVSWASPSTENSYQPQQSADNATWTNLGPALIGSSVNSVFDETPSPFYRVLENSPSITQTIYNGEFSEDGLFNDEADGWNAVQSQLAFRLTTGGRTDDGPCMQISVLNGTPAAPNGSEIQQNTKDADLLNPGAGAIIPGNSYNFSFWAKQISSGVSYEQRYKVSFLGDDGKILGDGGFVNFPLSVTGNWVQRTQSGLVAPAGATSALIQILGVTGAVDGGLGEVLIDDVSLLSSGFGSPTVSTASTIPALKISWQSLAGRSYQVRSSLDLNEWSDFGAVIPGDGSIKSVYDTMVDSAQFYKVGELP